MATGSEQTEARMAKILALRVRELTHTVITTCTWNGDNTFKLTDDQGVLYYVTVKVL